MRKWFHESERSNHLIYMKFEFEMEPLKDYIEFFHGNGCFSFAGRDGKKQKITLGAYCAEEHTLIHEVSFF